MKTFSLFNRNKYTPPKSQIILLFIGLLFFSQIKANDSDKENNSSPLSQTITIDQIFEQDQLARERAKSGKRFPLLIDERARRFEMFGFLARNVDLTADQLIKMIAVLQHTNLTMVNDKLISMSSENHLLTMQLAATAYRKGHPKGLHFIIWSYNYFLQGVGCSIDEYGFYAVDKKIKPNSMVSNSERANNCGWFDPIPFYQDLNLLTVKNKTET